MISQSTYEQGYLSGINTVDALINRSNAVNLNDVPSYQDNTVYWTTTLPSNFDASFFNTVGNPSYVDLVINPVEIPIEKSTAYGYGMNDDLVVSYKQVFGGIRLHR